MPAGDVRPTSPSDPTSSPSVQGPAPAKRRKTANSSRGVANLTPDQLERKRANDREAQRAIRERTRNQIDALNARIKELESSQPFHDLQQALRQRDAVQAENETIKRKLGAVIGILQPLLGTQGLNELAAAAEQNPLPLQAAAAEGDALTQLAANETGSYHGSGLPTGQPSQAVHSPSNQTSATGRDWHGDEGSATSMRGWPTPNSGWEPARDALDPSLQYGQSDERLGVDFLLDNSQRIVSIQSGGPAAAQGGGFATDSHDAPTQTGKGLDAWSTLPKFFPSTCPLDTLLVDFMNERNRLARSGVSRAALAGPKYPNFDVIMDPNELHKAHDVSKLFTDILPSFPDISRIPEKVAVVYVMFMVMRWLVHPSRETYETMPEWIQPRPSQLFTAYPAWCTWLPWPRLRDHVVTNPPAPPLDQFFIPYTTSLSLNWPYEASTCLIRNPTYSAASAATAPAPSSSSPPPPSADQAAYPSQWILNPAFESHLRDLSNWSLGPSFKTEFPVLAESVRIKEGER